MALTMIGDSAPGFDC